MDRGSTFETVKAVGGRCLALALLLGCGAGLWFGVAEPVLNQIEVGKSQIDSKRQLLAKYLAIAQTNDSIDRALEQAKSHSSGGEVFTGSSAEIAAAELQSKLQSFAAANRIAFRSARPLTVRKDGDNTLIGVRVHFAGELRKMQQVVHTIENALPYMFIEAAQVTGGRNPAQNEAKPQILLNAQLDIYGVFQASSSE